MEVAKTCNSTMKQCGSNAPFSGVKSEIEYIIVKLAARCNIACTYCYWFKDESVYKMPKKMLPTVQEAFANRLKQHLIDYPGITLPLVFHGGEPLLFGKINFDNFCSLLRERTANLKSYISFSITTNAMLVDQEWVDIFKKHDICISISLDGNQEMNDTYRVDFKGEGTYSRVLQGIKLLQKSGLRLGYLAVCNPISDPKELLRHFYHDLNINSFDVLIPENTHDVPYISIADYFISLFDEWFANYADKGVKIRIIDCMIKLLMGQESLLDSIGYGDVRSVTLYTDGKFGGSDEVNSTGTNVTHLNVFDHPLTLINQAPDWKEILEASRNLHEKCNKCRYKMECGGGSLQTRWKSTNRFDNPSIYCDDYQRIFDHIASALLGNIQ